MGGGRRRGLGPGRGCLARGRSLTCSSPGRGPGMGSCGSARTRLGAGLAALGTSLAAPGARSPHPTGAAAVSAPSLSSGSGARRAARARAGGGVGGGPRLGSDWGLGPRAGSAPERRARGSARGALPAQSESTAARAGAHTPTLTWGRLATDSRPRGQEKTHADSSTRQGAPTPTWGCFATGSHPRGHGQARTDTGQRAHTDPRRLGDPTPDTLLHGHELAHTLTHTHIRAATNIPDIRTPAH